MTSLTPEAEAILQQLVELTRASNPASKEHAPLERSWTWYAASLSVPVLALLVLGCMLMLFGWTWSWSELFGKGELLLVAIPVSVFAGGTLFTAPERSTDEKQQTWAYLDNKQQTWAILVGLFLANAFSFGLLCLNEAARVLLKQTPSDGPFLIASVLLFLVATVLGALAVARANERHRVP